MKQKGQSIFEFIIFLPVILALYIFLTSIGNSLNGAINQQKVTRGYFFNRIKNNSMVPSPQAGAPGKPVGAWSRFGLSYIGWRQKWATGGQIPEATCYRLALPLGQEDGDRCESWENNTTQYIRPQVIFGLCGTTYRVISSMVKRDSQVSDVGACLLR